MKEKIQQMGEPGIPSSAKITAKQQKSPAMNHNHIFKSLIVGCLILPMQIHKCIFSCLVQWNNNLRRNAQLMISNPKISNFVIQSILWLRSSTSRWAEGTTRLFFQSGKLWWMNEPYVITAFTYSQQNWNSLRKFQYQNWINIQNVWIIFWKYYRKQIKKTYWAQLYCIAYMTWIVYFLAQSLMKYKI